MTQADDARDDMGRLMVLSAEDIAALPWKPMADQDGVSAKTLWRSGDVAIGLMRVEQGAQKARHVHHGAHHHIWIVAGSATIVGQQVSAGSYLYIPPGVEHEVADVGPEGCTFFYTYRPVDVRRREPQLAGAVTFAE